MKFCLRNRQIEEYLQKADEIKMEYRDYKSIPDLFEKYPLTKQDKKLLEEYDSNITPKWETDALEKGHKFIKNKGDK